EMAEATIQGKPGVAAMVLDNLYEFFCNRPIPPRATDGSDGNKMSILNLLDALHDENMNHIAKTLERKPLPLRSMENDEIALGKGIKQPGFARPTAVSLLHVANRDARNAVLAAAVPADELRVQQRNEKLLNEHNLLHKAYRYAEPQRFAPVDHRRLAAIGKKDGKSESVFKCLSG
ncbi:spermatogenesis-associated protein 4, partial [Trypanosoma cruzi]